jgi:hypothetical protein
MAFYKPACAVMLISIPGLISWHRDLNISQHFSRLTDRTIANEIFGYWYSHLGINFRNGLPETRPLKVYPNYWEVGFWEEPGTAIYARGISPPDDQIPSIFGLE